MRNTRKITTHFTAAVLLLLLTCRAVSAYAGDSSLEIAALPEANAAVSGYHSAAAHASASSAVKIPEASAGGSCDISTSSSQHSAQTVTGGSSTSSSYASSHAFAFGTCQHPANEIPGTVNGTDEQPGNGSEWEFAHNEISSNAASGAVSAFSASYLMGYAESIALHQHLGDLRGANVGNGLWLRTHGGKFESAARNFVREFDTKYGGVLAGYDRKVSGTNGNLYIGAMFGYAKGDLRYLYHGKGKVDSKTVGIYASYSGAGGTYADLTIKYQWLDNRFEALDAAGGNVRTGGPGASLEIGRRFHMNAREKQGWYLEPHAQLSYSRQGGGTFRVSNGLNISADGFTSLTGRAGVTAGYDNGRTNFYFKAAREKEFDGEVSVITDGKRVTEDFGGSRWLFGIGLTSRINDRSSLYLTLDRSKGGSFTRPWAINAGWSITL